MELEVVTLADRPDLAEQAFAVGPPEHAFMQQDQTGWLYTSALSARWAEHALLLLDRGTVVARAMTVPFAFGSDRRPELPRDGWDGVIRWAAEDALVGTEPNCLAALEITVDTGRRGSGISQSALGFVLDHARRLGFPQVVCPVRPTEKSSSGRVDMTEYMRLSREDGSPR